MKIEGRQLLFIVKHFKSLAQIKESFDMVLAAASLGFDVSLLFMGDGVFQLICSKESDLSALMTALPFYDIGKIYVAQESLEQRQLVTQNLMLPAACLLSNEIAKLVADHDLIF